MKVYVQFLVKSEVSDKNVELLGITGNFTLDGRNNLQTWIQDAKDQINRLTWETPFITGFRIIKSSRYEDSETFPVFYEELVPLK